MRAYNGENSRWYQVAMREKAGRITGAGLSKEVTFEPVDDATNDRIDDAYRLKYQGSSYLSPMIGTRSRSATLADVERWSDTGLVREGLRLFKELPRTAPTEVLLATDLHAGNVLRSEREPWLVIDPKPFVGDPAYDATQHLFNCDARLRSDPNGTICRIADLLGVDRERVRLWTFARAAAEPRDSWRHDDS